MSHRCLHGKTSLPALVVYSEVVCSTHKKTRTKIILKRHKIKDINKLRYIVLVYILALLVFQLKYNLFIFAMIDATFQGRCLNYVNNSQYPLLGKSKRILFEK